MIVPLGVIDDKYPGGLRAYEADCPNNTFCMDESLTRVGFMDHRDVQMYVKRLETLGFTFFDGTKCIDIVVVDQFQGPTAPSEWCDFGTHAAGFSVAWRRGTSPSPMAAPRDWKIGDSKKYQFSATLDPNVQHLKLDVSQDIDVYLDYKTGREVFVARIEGTRVSNALAARMTPPVIQADAAAASPYTHTGAASAQQPSGGQFIERWWGWTGASPTWQRWESHGAVIAVIAFAITGILVYWLRGYLGDFAGLVGLVLILPIVAMCIVVCGRLVAGVIDSRSSK